MNPIIFEHPITVADLDMIATVEVTDYIRGRAQTPTQVGWPEEVEFRVTELRLDKPDEDFGFVHPSLSDVLSTSDDLRQACLEAIEDHNQPPEA